MIPCRLYLQLNCLSVLPCGEWKQWGFFFLCCLVLCVNRPYVFPLCTLGVFLCFFFFKFFYYYCFLNVGYIQDCLFPRRGKNKFKSRLSPPRGSFSLSWIMATITEDIGLGGACFIKLRVLGRMQNKLVEWESRCVCDELHFNLYINYILVILSNYRKPARHFSFLFLLVQI